MRAKRNPFQTLNRYWVVNEALDADYRIRMVRDFTADECNQALQLVGLQKIVITAIERRLKKLGSVSPPQAEG